MVESGGEQQAYGGRLVVVGAGGVVFVVVVEARSGLAQGSWAKRAWWYASNSGKARRPWRRAVGVQFSKQASRQAGKQARKVDEQSPAHSTQHTAHSTAQHSTAHSTAEHGTARHGAGTRQEGRKEGRQAGRKAGWKAESAEGAKTGTGVTKRSLGLGSAVGGLALLGAWLERELVGLGRELAGRSAAVN